MMAEQQTSESHVSSVLQLDLVLPLLLRSAEARIVEAPGTKKKQYAYEVTFVAVVPEEQLRILMTYVKEHKVPVQCIGPNSLKGE